MSYPFDYSKKKLLFVPFALNLALWRRNTHFHYRLKCRTAGAAYGTRTRGLLLTFQCLETPQYLLCQIIFCVTTALLCWFVNPQYFFCTTLIDGDKINFTIPRSCKIVDIFFRVISLLTFSNIIGCASTIKLNAITLRFFIASRGLYLNTQQFVIDIHNQIVFTVLG